MCFGAVIGAYSGTIEYRIRKNLPLITTKCYCPICNHELSVWFQFPVLSWIALGGKCYYCKSKISFRYPFIEAGFTAIYIISFLFLHQKPLLLISIWIFFIGVFLLLRCNKNYRMMIKGFFIMLLYHLLYGGVLMLVILASNS